MTAEPPALHVKLAKARPGGLRVPVQGCDVIGQVERPDGHRLVVLDNIKPIFLHAQPIDII